jgi:hypothetical protein
MGPLVRRVACLVGLLCSAGEGAAAPTPVQADADDLRAIAAEAYVWGYASVDMHAILSGQVLDGGPADPAGRANAVLPTRRVATPDDTLVIAPNVDTPYAHAWLDLRGGPVVVEVPPFEDDRYVALQLFDAYSWILGYVSPRTHGRDGARVLVAGPGWEGDTPEGIDGVFRSPTTLALGLFRTQWKGGDDLARVHAIQDGFRVVAADGGPAPVAPWPPLVAPIDLRTAPLDPRFFEVLAWMQRFMPLGDDEAALRERLARLGLAGDGRFVPPAGSEAAIAAGMRDGLQAIQARAATVRSSAELFGTRERLGNDHLVRATGAMLGILGNAEEEYLGVGWPADAEGRPFDGTHRYRVRFAPGALPPVGAFWSITVYDGRRLLYANPIDRQVINSTMLDRLARDPDGGITLWIQHARPEAGDTNWLPVPAAPFVLTFRTYQPGQAIRDGRWRAPPVERVD